MKVCIVQPHYSVEYQDSESLFRWELEAMDKWAIVERAIRYGCKKVQLVKAYFDQALIDKAHAHGIRCNVFWSDDPEETREFLRMGIDTILTNDYHRIAGIVKEFK